MLKKALCFVLAFALTAAFAAIPANIARAAEGALAGRTVILDPGHGLYNSNVYEGYDEAVAMLALAQKIKPILEANGATVHMTRPDKNNVSVYARAAKVNIWALGAVKSAGQSDAGEIDRLIGIMQSIIDDPEKNAAIYMNYPFDYELGRKIHPDLKKVFEYENHAAINNFLMISLHSNATGVPINESVHGANAFYMSNSHDWMKSYYTDYSYEKSNVNFAGKILDAIDKIGISKRKAEAACYVVIREHNVPAVLIENGFHTNAADRAKLSDDKFLDKLAQAYADATIAYFSEIPLSKAPEKTPDLPQGVPAQSLDANDVKVFLNGYMVKWTANPMFFEGELYFSAEDVARISGNSCDASGILYMGRKYVLKKPLVSGEKLFISAGELLSIQKSVLWADVKIDVKNLQAKLKINKYCEPKWDETLPSFVNGELYIPLDPVLKALGYASDIQGGVLNIYRDGKPVYRTKTGYMVISDALCISASGLNAIKNVLWASFDLELY